MARVALVIAVGVLSALGLSACGNSAAAPTPATPPNNLITQAEVAKQPEESVQRAFLQYWSALQFQSWAEAVAFYAPAMRESVGTADIIGGKKVNAPSYPELKPEIISTRNSRGTTTIKYTLQFIDGTRELASISWRQEDGNWFIVFDSRLEAELRQYAENSTELEETGALPTEASAASPAAGKAGAEAARAQPESVQAEFEREKRGP